MKQGMGLHNTVQEMFPLFIWKRSAASAGALRPKWLHDLCRPIHRPYAPKEIEIIRRFTALADEDFEREAHKKMKKVILISILDIAPTVAKIMGVPAPREWEGKPLI